MNASSGESADVALRPRLIALAAAAILLWKPTVLVYGVQRAGLYAAVAIPMALVLGIVHIVNLAHGEFLMVAAYLTYFAGHLLGVDPFVALVPIAVVMAALGLAIYQLAIKHTLKAPELNQLILTFGLGIALSQGVNLVFTSQSLKLSLGYVSASATIGDMSFGVYDFVFAPAAIASATGSASSSPGRGSEGRPRRRAESARRGDSGHRRQQDLRHRLRPRGGPGRRHRAPCSSPSRQSSPTWAALTR